MSEWKPLNENHAIAVMGAYIRLEEEIPDLLFRKILNEMRDIAAELGLTQERPSQSFQIKMSPRGIEPNQEGGILGHTFFRPPDFVGEGKDEIFTNIENIQVEKGAIVYRTWDYVSWKWQIGRIKSLISPLLNHAASVVAFSRIGLEYLDKFSAQSDEVPEISALLDPGGPFVCPHIFHDPSLFHVHTGRFVNVLSNVKTRENVKINATDADGERVVDITTTVERIYDAANEENENPLSVWSDLHSEAKALLGAVITDDRAKRIFLND